MISGTFNKDIIINKKAIDSNLYKGYITDITFIVDLEKWNNK